MKTTFPVLLLAVIVGCGGGDNFEGVWSGTLRQQATCSNGESTVRDFPMLLDVSQDGRELSINGNAACGTFSARTDGSRAALRYVKCQTLPGDGFTYTDSLEGGTMEVREDILEVNAQLSTVFRAATGQTITCMGPLTGVLHRKK